MPTDEQRMLVHLAKNFGTESYYFELLIYSMKFINNFFLHEWIVNRETNLMSLLNPWLIHN